MVKYNMRTLALPFDNIISKFEGIIDCINNNFNNYFPKIIKRENVSVGTHQYTTMKLIKMEIDIYIEGNILHLLIMI